MILYVGIALTYNHVKCKIISYSLKPAAKASFLLIIMAVAFGNLWFIESNIVAKVGLLLFGVGAISALPTFNNRFGFVSVIFLPPLVSNRS
jgi:hypothetical protein